MSEQLLINVDGSIEHLDGHLDLGNIGKETVKRASNVEPSDFILRRLFHLTRKYFPSLTQWTRTWPCNWRVHIIEFNLVFEAFENRDAAIAFEVQWLEDYRL